MKKGKRKNKNKTKKARTKFTRGKGFFCTVSELTKYNLLSFFFPCFKENLA